MCHAWYILKLSFLSRSYRSSHCQAIQTSHTQLFGCTAYEQLRSYLPGSIRILLLLLPLLWQEEVALALGLHETEALHLIN